jgi:hypothetical protein
MKFLLYFAYSLFLNLCRIKVTLSSNVFLPSFINMQLKIIFAIDAPEHQSGPAITYIKDGRNTNCPDAS